MIEPIPCTARIATTFNRKPYQQIIFSDNKTATTNKASQRKQNVPGPKATFLVHLFWRIVDEHLWRKELTILNISDRDNAMQPRLLKRAAFEREP